MIVEILIYLVAAISALVVTGFTVHMFIGGLVTPEAEYQYMALACIVVAGVIAYMAWDVIQRRTGKK